DLPLRLLPLLSEAMCRYPFGVPVPPPFSLCTVTGGRSGDTLPAASRARTVMTWSASELRPPHSPVRTLPPTEPHALPSANRSYATTPVSSVEAPHDTVALVAVTLTWVGAPGAVG